MYTPNEVTACKKKTRYNNDPAAQEALKRINPTRTNKKPWRVYKCPVCNGWHLSSKPKQ